MSNEPRNVHPGPPGLQDGAPREPSADDAFCQQFLRTIRHDLGNSLNAVAMAAQVLQSRAYIAEADGRLVELIARSAAQMNRMLKLLFGFTYARVEGGLRIEPQTADLRAISQHVLDELTVGHSVPISSQLDGSLTGTWDTDRIADLLLILLGNTVDHVPAGVTIVLAATGDDEHVGITIHGPGATLPQEDSLDLCIARELVHAHGGTLGIASSPGPADAARFTVRLPREPQIS